VVTKKEREQKIWGMGQQSLMIFPLESAREISRGEGGEEIDWGRQTGQDTKRTLADDDDDDISMMMKQ